MCQQRLAHGFSFNHCRRSHARQIWNLRIAAFLNTGRFATSQPPSSVAARRALGGGMGALPCGSDNYLILLSLQRKYCTAQGWLLDRLDRAALAVSGVEDIGLTPRLPDPQAGMFLRQPLRNPVTSSCGCLIYRHVCIVRQRIELVPAAARPSRPTRRKGFAPSA